MKLVLLLVVLSMEDISISLEEYLKIIRLATISKSTMRRKGSGLLSNPFLKVLAPRYCHCPFQQPFKSLKTK